MQMHLILAFLVSFCSYASSQSECKPTIQTETDFQRSDVGFGYSPDAAHCQKLCTQHPRCRHFTYVWDNMTLTNLHYKCHFKFTTSGEPSGVVAGAGLASGYSLKPCDPEPLLCLSEVYPNLEFLGTNYKSLVMATYEECQRVCTRDPFCQFFTFVKENSAKTEERYKCHLKYSWSIPRPPAVNTLAGVVSGFANRSNIFINFTNACESTLFSDTESQENSFESVPAASAETCQALCSAHPCCTYFSYESGTFTCNMMNNSDELITQAKVGFISGLPVYECLMNSNWVTAQHDGVDFFGSDIEKSQQDTLDDCQDACNADRNCQFYTYLTDDFGDPSRRKECFVKRVITMPAPDKIEKVDNVVSGFPDICV